MLQLSLIILVNRDDLPKRHKQRTVDSLKLYHFGLPVDAIKKAEIIVFVEGEDFKILRSAHGESSLSGLAALMNYASAIKPAPQEHPPMKLIHFKPKRPHGNLRRRKFLDD